MFLRIISRTRSDTDNVGSKTRSLSQITEKRFVHHRGFIFQWIIMKLCDKVCFDNNKVKFKTESCQVKD